MTELEYKNKMQVIEDQYEQAILDLIDDDEHIPLPEHLQNTDWMFKDKSNPNLDQKIIVGGMRLKR